MRNGKVFANPRSAAGIAGAMISSVVAGLCIAAAPLAFEYVPPDPPEPNGPAYGFFISKFEVRNDQFVQFLDDARQHPSDERGQYLCFDADGTGVFIHSDAAGQVSPSCAGTPIFLVTDNPHVSWHSGTSAYYVQPGFESHPVTGVSWYGAIKYCNWLTLNDGVSTSERVYGEGTSAQLSGWRPVTIDETAWSTRDLNATERTALLGKRGYRLPMDGGAIGGNPGPFNEWFKAAAWDGLQGVHRRYGFGRDALGGADANYSCSGDPFEDAADCQNGGTTPVGFFDGTVYEGGFATRTDENPFALFDLSGNVWEWMQDHGGVTTARRNRGGSFRSSPASLVLDSGADRAAVSTSDSTGFRVVLIPEVAGQLVALPAAHLDATGPWGGPYSNVTASFAVINVSHTNAVVDARVDAPWVTFELLDGSSLAPGEQTRLSVRIEPVCEDGLVLGDNFAELTIGTSIDGAALRRRVQLRVEEPLNVEISDGGEIDVVFGETLALPVASLQITNASEAGVTWSVETIDRTDPIQFIGSAAWLTVNGRASLDGETSGGGVSSINVRLNPDQLQSVAPGVYAADVLVRDDCTGEAFVHGVSVQVLAPLVLGESPLVSVVTNCGVPEVDELNPLRLTNPTTRPFAWSAAVDRPDLVEVDVTSGTLAPGATATVKFELTQGVADLPAGQQVVTVEFIAAENGFRVQGGIAIDARPLPATPAEGLVFRGPAGGPFESTTDRLVIENPGGEELVWSAVFRDDSNIPAGHWVSVVPSGGAILDQDGTAVLLVRPGASAAQLPPGTYSGFIDVETNGGDGCRAKGTVTLIIFAPVVSMEMSVLPGDDHQAGGAEHTFRVARFELTNQEFVQFLNDTVLNPESGRAAYMQHGSPPTGLVTLSGDGTPLFDASVGEAIEFRDGYYVVVGGFRDLPVVGVSWYGAIKFCNWLTLMQGMSNPDQRVYHEGPTRDDWFPIGSEAELIAGGVAGFRLPMDGGVLGPGLYSEWHKAASRAEVGTGGAPVFGSVYGFGRNVLAETDANFAVNGGASTHVLTPVGFFDGVNLLSNGLRTRDTGNGYQLHDLTGNVAEWMHGPGNTPTSRPLRGGHFLSVMESPSLRVDTREFLPADTVAVQLGFRIAQSVVPTAITVNSVPRRVRGVIGGPLDAEMLSLEMMNPAAHAHDDVTVTTDVPWLVVENSDAIVLAPGGVSEFQVKVDARPGSAGTAPLPGAEFVLIPGSDGQLADGPVYDFFMQRTEVTNSRFAQFLNDTLANVRAGVSADARSAYMFFDAATGDVLISDEPVGEEGLASPDGPFATKLYDASIGRVRRVAGTYSTESGFGEHPVVGVSWYGAVKYCNWMNFRDGIPTELWAYDETASLDGTGWGPAQGVDIASWMNATMGYRLPVDHGVAGADHLNEWYKAAAWNPSASEPNRTSLYAFGRDELTPADANHDEGLDRLADGTTEVGHYDGERQVPSDLTECYSSFPTVKTNSSENRYGLHDLSGNVAEWLSDDGILVGERAIRGGSWRDRFDSPMLTNSVRGSLRSDECSDDVGFRVVRDGGQLARITVHDGISDTDHVVHVILELMEPLVVEPTFDQLVAIRYGAVSASGEADRFEYIVTNRSDMAMQWSADVDAGWLTMVADDGPTHGTLASMHSVTVVAQLNGLVEDLAPGSYTAQLSIRNLDASAQQVCRIHLSIMPPLSLTASDSGTALFEGVFGGPFESPLTVREYGLSNQLSRPIRYNIQRSEDWLSVESSQPLAGTVAGGAERQVRLGIGSGAASLSVGDHRAVLRVDYTDPKNQVMGALKEEVTLRIQEPVSVTPTSDWGIQGPLDPRALPTRTYELMAYPDRPTELVVSTDVPWVVVGPTFVQLPENGAAEILAQLDSSALQLPEGVHRGTIFIENLRTGVVQCRSIDLSVGASLRVGPVQPWNPRMLRGGKSPAPMKTYRLWNDDAEGGDAVDWTATVVPAVDWLQLIDSADGGTLDPGASTAVTAAIDETVAQSLKLGEYTAEIEFVDLTNGVVAVREVVLAVAAPAFFLEEQVVPLSAAQPDGPAYTFFITRGEVTNAEFAGFLNDAMAHAADERGAFMYVDLATGEVYVNTHRQGEAGDGPAGRAVKMFSPSIGGRIQFGGGQYSVVTTPIDYTNHPVVGVSWYGALKYSNWLTLDHGMQLTDRCYGEDVAANLPGWCPVVVDFATWQSRDLNAAERADLVGMCAGYRLPMDNGANNSVTTADAADLYNEWFKAAAWQSNLQPPRNTVYAFGRDLLTPTDANFRDNGDAFDNGTTPSGWFSMSDANASGVVDLTGNAYEWIQDRFNQHPDSIAFRTIRGGGWKDAAGSVMLRTTSRTFTSPARTDEQIGFRVVRALPPPTADVDGDGDVDGLDAAALTFALTGPGGGASAYGAQDFDGDGDVDLADVAVFQRVFASP